MSENENGVDSTKRRRLILLAVVVAVLLCLVVALAVNLFLRPGDDVAGGDTPTPTVTPTEEGPIVIVTPEGDNTPTPTRVISEQPTEEPTAEPTSEPTAEPTATPAPPTPAASSGADFTPSSGQTVYETRDIIKNGGFEQGFSDMGVAQNWQAFKTDSAVISFSAETFEPQIHAGSSAQRISVENAFQPDRYAGIYQTAEVVANQPYTFTIYGQARSLHGDLEKSGYGYRVQYAVDNKGGQDWQKVPADAWVEFPWGEQLLNAPNPEFSMYTTVITPAANEITLFVRAWNKWADPKLVEYTFDSISLVGPDPNSAILVSRPGDEEQMVDGALPVTGEGDFANFMADGRFWGAVLVLLLLAAGAVYRARWSW